MDCNNDEAARAKEIADSKLLVNDTADAKKFALKAQRLCPSLDWLSQMMAVIDVYIAAESGESDWELISVSGEQTSQFAIHAQIKFKNSNAQCGFTDIYASTDRHKRVPFWTKVIDIAANGDNPELFAGDFNTLRFSDEKQGGAYVSISQLEELNTVLRDGGLEEIPTSGAFSSWNYKRNGEANIQERLDRAVANKAWFEGAPSTSA